MATVASTKYREADPPTVKSKFPAVAKDVPIRHGQSLRGLGRARQLRDSARQNQAVFSGLERRPGSPPRSDREQPGSRSVERNLAQRAEGERFELSIRLATDNGFRDRRIRPLCHPSAGASLAGVRSRSAPGRRPGSGPPSGEVLGGAGGEGEDGLDLLGAGASPRSARCSRAARPAARAGRPTWTAPERSSCSAAGNSLGPAAGSARPRPAAPPPSHGRCPRTARDAGRRRSRRRASSRRLVTRGR